MKLILQFIKPYRKQIIFVVLAMILDVAGGLLIPTITADIINNGIGGGSLPYIIRQGILMAAVSLFASLGALAGSYFCSDLAARLGRDIRNAVYDKSLLFSDSDLEKFGTASMITRTLSDINIIQQSVIMFIQMILPVPVIFVIALLLSFRLDVEMGFILLGVVLAVLIIAFIIIRSASPLFKKLQKLLDRMSTVLLENITGVRVVRAFNNETREEKRMAESFSNYAETSIKANRRFANLDGLSFFCINFFVVTVYWLSGGRISAGHLQIGDITAVIEYAMMVLFFLMMAQMVILTLPRALECCE